MYEVISPRAYSAGLQSPSQAGLPHYSNISDQHDEKANCLLLSDFGDIQQRLQGAYPSLSDQAPAVQEDMRYQRPDTHHFGLRSGEGTTFFKAERSDTDYRAPDFPAHLPFDQIGLKPEEGSTFKTERADQNFGTTDFPTSPTFHHVADSSYSHPGMPNLQMSSYAPQGVEGYQPPSQYVTSRGYISPEAGHSGSFDYFPLVPQGSDLALGQRNDKPPPTKRGPFKDLQKREKTAQVRKIGSCIRCRMQRIRVGTNHENSTGQWD